MITDGMSVHMESISSSISRRQLITSNMIAFAISIVLLIVLAVTSHRMDSKPTDRERQEMDNTEFDYGHDVKHEEQ